MSDQHALNSPPMTTLSVGDRTVQIVSLVSAVGAETLITLPFSRKVLAENILRKEPDAARRQQTLMAVVQGRHDTDIPFRPERVVLQDMLGTAVLTDLAALRDEVMEAGGPGGAVNPAVPTHLVVDHSLNVDVWGQPDARAQNEAIERARNAERFRFMRWASGAFSNLSIIGSGSGILHQINLERLTPVVGEAEGADGVVAFPDSLVGTDSHTPMINAAGVLGWGVGGLEAEVAMLGAPLMMRLPEVVGVRLSGSLQPGVLATDLALALAEQLRELGVVGAILEFCGPGLAALPLPDRATVANMAPEYGATAAIFPIDERTLDYMRLSGRSEDSCRLTAAYARAQGLWATDLEAAQYDREVPFDLGSVTRSMAGPRQPHERISVASATAGATAGATTIGPTTGLPERPVVIAAITSCTNTSNPRTMLTAALLARNAHRLGLKPPAWVRTSFAPGSRVVSEYLAASGLQEDLDALGFEVIGFGCTTCNGLSGPLLPDALKAEIEARAATAVAVTSGNRNFEGRVHPEAREVYIMSPPLIVAYALAGQAAGDISSQTLGFDASGKAILLSDLWPSDAEVAAYEEKYVGASAFSRGYQEIDEQLARARSRRAERARAEGYAWEANSTYVRRPPYWSLASNDAPARLANLRPLVILGDHITTDHISPSGTILPSSDTAQYLRGAGLAFEDFNSYGSRRGNFEAAQRATFASPRLQNEMLADGASGPITILYPEGERLTIHQAAAAYAARDEGLIVVAGRNYGSGSSRDWAAKGPRLLGVRVVLAESFERIHRQNLAAIGILPLEFQPGVSRASLELTGTERFTVLGLDQPMRPGRVLTVQVTRADGRQVSFEARARLDTEEDVAYFRNGGLLQQLKSEILAGEAATVSQARALQ